MTVAAVPATVVYTLDANNIITGIQACRGDEWEAGTDPASAVGSNLLWHINGIESAAFIKTILDDARRGNCRSVPYRCDSPFRRRRWLMDVLRIPNDGLMLRHTLVEDTPFRSPWSFRSSVNFANAVPRCSICNRVFIHCSWEDPDEELARRNGLSATNAGILDVVYGICSSCRLLAPNAFGAEELSG